MTTNCMCSIGNKEYVGDPTRIPTDDEIRKYNIWQCMCGKWLFVNQELVKCVECNLHFSRSVPLNVCHNCLGELKVDDKREGMKKGENMNYDRLIRDIAGIPWIKVVASTQAWEEYRMGDMHSRIIHREFGAAICGTGSNVLLDRLSNEILLQYIIVIYHQHICDCHHLAWEKIKYPWDVEEGKGCREFTRSEIDDYLKDSLSICDLESLKLPSNLKLWLIVRKPFRIEVGSHITELRGRFGCGVFHKAAKRVEDV